MLDIGKGELLHLPVFGGPEVRAEAHAGPGGQYGRSYTQRQCRQSYHRHFKARHENIAPVRVPNAYVHNIAHDLGQYQLQHRFSRRTQDPQHNDGPVSGGIIGQFFLHLLVSSVSRDKLSAMRSK